MKRQSLLLLRQPDVARLIDMPSAIRLARAVFIAHARGRCAMPAKIYLPLPRGDFRAMPAYLEKPAACGIKWVNVHPRNPGRRLPSVMAMIVLNDPATGVPLAVMDGSLITKLRTAAAAAVAAQSLARPDSHVVGLIGCGMQAAAQIEALTKVLPISHVKVWGFRPGEAAGFCRRQRVSSARLTWEPVRTSEAAARGADIIVTITPSRHPLLKLQWIGPGTHINAIGADGPGKQELDFRILRRAIVVVDELTQAIHGGELNVPVVRGQYDPKDIHASLGEILIGQRRGRKSRADITVFDSTGLAIHDIALGFEGYRRACRKAIGRRIALL